MFLSIALALLSGCVSDVIIDKEGLVFEGESEPVFASGTKPLKLHIPDVEDLRENKENVVGAKAGFRLIIPYYQKYKVEGHPPEIIHQFLSDKLRSMGFNIVPDDSEAQTILQVSLKEFSRSGWGATVAWGNSSRIVVGLKLYPTGGKEPVWQDNLYGEGDDLEDSLKGLAENLENHRTFKIATLAIASTPAFLVIKTEPLLDTADSGKPDTQAPTIHITSHNAFRNIHVVQGTPEFLVKGVAEDPSGIAEVTVNGKPVFFSNKGRFSTKVPLNIGANTIWVTAKDTNNNIRRKSFSVKRIGKTARTPSTGALDFGKYVALIIGNQNYRNLPQLVTPHNDAIEIARVLENRYGFQTEILLDARRDDIMEKLNEIRARLNENDNLLIYYAGHGFFDRTANKAYWQPVDAQQNSDAKWIIVDSITSNIKRMASKHILIVVDSCYSGTLTRGSPSRLGGQTMAHKKYIRKMLGKTSRTLMASGGNEPVSDEGGGDHSIFASVFLEGLKSVDRKYFTAEELFYDFIKQSVAGRADQTPEYNTIRNSGHNGGDFIFHKQP